MFFFFAKSKGQIASGFYSFFYSTINLYFHSEFQGMVLPHNAVLVLHSGLIKLVANDKSFPRLFESQYSLLSTLLFQHPEAVYGAVHVFITCVRSILCMRDCLNFAFEMKWLEKERKERRSYTGGGGSTGGKGRGEGIISTQGEHVLSQVSCAWLHSKNFDIA